MMSHAESQVGGARRRPLSLNVPVVVEIVDAELPGGNRNRMQITVWIDAADNNVPASSAARSLTIGFLERALETLRSNSGTSFEAAALPEATSVVER